MKMHQTPDVPGTSPVTDNPNPGGTQGADTTGPSTGPARPEDIAIGPSSGTEGWGQTGDERDVLGRAHLGAEGKRFRCADAGFADCKWEAQGRDEAELMPQIERHGREQHGVREMDEGIVAKIKRTIREMAA